MAARTITRAFAALPPGALVIAACWVAHQAPEVPPTGLLLALAAGGAALLAASLRGRADARPALPRIALLVGVAALAFAGALLRAERALGERLDAALEGRDLEVEGVVLDMPQAFERGQRFRFGIERCLAPQAPCPGAVTVRLGWYAGFGERDRKAVPELWPGQRWRLSVRLKRPHAPLNPGLFDAELRALEEGVSATGFVRGGDSALLDGFVPRPGLMLERLRAHVRAAMVAATPDLRPEVRGVLVALVVGDQGAIAARWWETFNLTGIGHLMSISGLHITMLAALGAWVANGLWRHRRLASAMAPRPLAAWLPTPHARWILGLSVAFGYAGLAGWGIPAQRTCWMLAAAGLSMLSGRARAMPVVLCNAGTVVCLLDPWAPLAAGFWLSFAAVAAIVWFGSAQTHAQHLPRWRETLRSALRSQLAATLVLLPLGVLFFSSVSLVSPVANAVAIPLVSAVVTPLALAGGGLALVSPGLASLPLGIAGRLTGALLDALGALVALGSAAVALPLPSVPALLLAAAACLVVLAPMRWPGRAVAAAGFAPLMLTPPDVPAVGELRLTALDVGQGTAVLVETAGGRLLYDTGPQTGPDNEAGARIVVPYLRARGLRTLDALVVSHLDSDHSGGALSVMRGVPVAWAATSLDADHPIVTTARRHFACRRGERWTWGEAQFEWLHPGAEPEPHGSSPTNARSCVLRVRSPAGTLLLTGDVEAMQEKRLLALYGPDALRADVLLAPHHGSATSSTPAFLDAVAPAFAVFQVGYRNRYRHPHPKVLQRYHERSVVVLRTDADGAVSLRLRAGEPPQVTRWRLDDRRYWRLDVPAASPEGAPVP